MSRPEHVNAARVGFNWYSVVLLNDAKKKFPPMVEALADQHGLSEKTAKELSFAMARRKK
jgi:hypothetical protein